MKGSTKGATFYFFDEIRSKGFEQGGSEAEENASGKHFRRRGNEQSEAIARQCGTKSLALRQKIEGSADRFYLLFFR